MDENPPDYPKACTNKKIIYRKAAAKKTGKKNGRRKKVGWIAFVTLVSFILSAVLMYFTSITFNDISIVIAFVVLIIIVFTGIIFDIFGVAVTSADVKVFHSMASRKIKGSKQGILLINNADKVSNFCNDVVGDICGIISGACGALIVIKIVSAQHGQLFTVVNILISSAVAAFTVGGKAVGKSLAMDNSNNLVLDIAKFLSLFEKKKKKV